MIELRTTVDITKTDVRRNYNSLMEENEEGWTLRRNQQRNYDVVIQILHLRFLPVQVSEPVREGDEWIMEVEYETGGIDLRDILSDFEHVPVISGLTESTPSDCFYISGDKCNISLRGVNSIERILL